MPAGNTTDPNFLSPQTNPFSLSDVGYYAKPTFADIDGDGDLDVFVGNSYGDTLFFRNTGTTTAPTFTQEATNPFGLTNVVASAAPTLVDIDGDGDLDVFVGNRDGDTLFFRNTGTVAVPNFTQEATNPFGLITNLNLGRNTSPQATFADIDGDGDLDAFLGEKYGNTLFYRNTGTATAPTFTQEATNPFGLTNVGFSAAPTLADIDGDGDLDAFVGNNYGNTLFYRNMGTVTDPTFTQEDTNPFGLTNVGNKVRLTLADIDGDGDLDAFVGTYYGNIVFFENQPTSTPVNNAPTGSPTATLSNTAKDTAITINAADLLAGFTDVDPGDTLSIVNLTANNGVLVDNLDGTYTFTPTANFNGAVTLYYDVTDGTATLTGQTQTFSVGLTGVRGYAAPTLADIDNDGDLDAFVGNRDGDTLFFRNEGTATAPTFIQETSNFGLTNVGYFATPTLADIDNDGDLDAFVGSESGNIYFFRNTGTATAPTFTPEASNFGLTSVDALVAPTFADIDGDGDLDAFAGGSYGNTVFYRNTGTATAPTFTPEATNPFGLTDVGYNAAPTFADIDNDGDLDAFVGNYNGNNIVFYRNTGTAAAPTFTPEDTNLFGLTDVGVWAKPTFADIDNDGDLDAFVGNSYGDILFFENMVNNAPTGSPTATLSNTAEDTAITITASDLLAGFSDVDASDTLSVANLTADNGALVDNNDGTYTFTPTANFNGTVTLTYGVSDGTDILAGQTQTFSVTAVNDAPTISDPTLINFDDLSAGTVVSNQYEGVLFSTDSGYNVSVLDFASILNSSSPNLIGVTDSSGDVDGTQNLYLDFEQPVNNLSFRVVGDNTNGIAALITVYTADSSVQTINLVTDGDGFMPDLIDLSSFSKITRISINTITDFLGIGYDDFQFEPVYTLSNTAEDTAITITAADLLAGFSDVDAGDTLSVVNLTANNGVLVDNNDGTYTFTPTANFNGAVNLTYDVTDGTATLAGQTQTFSVTPVNDAPTGSPTATLSNTAEDTAITITAANLLAGFSDIEGDTLSVVDLTADNGGLVNNNNGTYTFTPDANFNGSVLIKYRVTDGTDTSDEQYQSFSVDAVNDAPTDSPTATLSNTAEDTAITITASDLLAGFSDVDGDTLSVVNLTADNGVLVHNNDGTYTFTPTANFNGAVTLNYDVTDGTDTLAGQTQNFSVTAVNDAPTGSPTATLSDTAENTDIIINAADLLAGFSDVDAGDTLSVANLTANNGVLVDNNDGTYTFTPTADFNGAVILNYDVTDGTDTLTGQTQTFSVTPVNDAPTGSPTATLSNTAEDTAITITAANLLAGFSDVEGDTLSVVNLTANNGALVNNNDGTYTFTPTANFNGAVNLSYGVSDGTVTLAGQTRSFSVTPVNDIATITGTATAAITEDAATNLTATGSLTVSDVDTNESVFNTTVTSVGNLGSLSITQNGAYSYSVANSAVQYLGAGQTKTETFTVQSVDGTASQNVVVTINGVNDAPTGSPTATLSNTAEDTAITITAANLLAGFSDVDGNTLSVVNLTANNGALVNNNNGTYTFTPTANFNGAVNLSYGVSDGTVTLAGQTQTFSVTAVNDAPVGVNDSATTAFNTALTIQASTLLANDTDVDNSVFSITGVSGVSNGTAVINNNGTATNTADDYIVFTPTTGFSGNATFNYTVSDSSLIGTASVFVAVGASITGGNGQDNITGTAGNDLIDGGNQNDILYGGGGNDYLYGGNGNDILYGDGFLGGGNGVDYLYGGNGDDILYGGMGNDVVTGNNGKDIFALAPEDGIDTITDFVDGQDKIGLYNGLTYGSLTISATNLGAEIAYGNSILAYLSGINANVINSTDFVNL